MKDLLKDFFTRDGKNGRLAIAGLNPLTAFLLSIAVALNFIIFRIVSSQEKQNVVVAIESILRDEYSTASSFQLSRSLGDLESLKVLSCVRLTELSGINRVFYDTSVDTACHKLPILKAALSTKIELNATNGLKYSLEFQSPIRWQNVALEVLGYFIAFGILALYLLSVKQQKLKKSSEQLKAEQLANQALQVLHDIRSPLATLDVVMLDAINLPDDQRDLIRSATNGIRDIANDLLRKARGSEGSALAFCLIKPIVEAAVSEKQVQHRASTGIKIYIDAGTADHLTFARIDHLELRRALSNLLENAIEATAEGEVRVRFATSVDEAIIEIKDSGKGIPDNIKARLGERGFSFQKDGTNSGSGLGIYHARKAVTEWGGTLEIESELGKGSVFRLRFPRSSAPQCLVDQLTINTGASVIVVDDDPNIRMLWEKRLRPIADIRITFFDSPSAFRVWFDANASARDQYMIDFDFPKLETNGLQLIEELEIKDRSLLVTARFDSSLIQDRAEQLGIKVLPKTLLSTMKICSRETAPSADTTSIVLLDNDQSIHRVWTAAARRKNIKILSFLRAEALIRALPDIDSNTEIFLDLNLDDERSGLEIGKTLYENGFRNLSLCTGASETLLEKPYWIKRVIGKVPPWL